MPSTDHAKHPSTTLTGRYSAAVIRRGEVKISDPIPQFQNKVDSSAQPYEDMTIPQQLAASSTVGTWPRRSTPPATAVISGTEGGQRNASQLALNRESSSPSAILSTMSSKNSLRQSKSGGFRATFKSLFGSKRHRSSLSNDLSYHISDPGNLVSIHEKPITRNVIRPPSQPILGVTQANPLGSHSPLTSTDGKRTRSADRVTTLSGRRRRNTLPSIVFSDQDAQQIRTIVNGTVAEQAVGFIASTDRINQMSKAPRRRSRSADALSELVATQAQSPSTWRQSLIDQPLPTLEPRGDGGTKRSATGMYTTRSSRLNSAVSSNSLKPTQNFDFGLLSDTSLEDRVKMLELKCFNFEYAIAGLQGYDVGDLMPISRFPKRRSMHENDMELNASTSSRADSAQGRTFLKSPGDSSSPSDEDRSQIQRSSANTIRPARANASPPQKSAAPSPNTITQKWDPYPDLLAMIKEERAARLQLESQVVELQKQVAAYAATHPSVYGSPSPESLYTEAKEYRARPLHRTPAFPSRSRNNIAETSRFSLSDTEESEADVAGFHDVYETSQKSKHVFGSIEVPSQPTVEIF